ncbi:SURF1 family protein [Stakelama pacifica]|uniref:SURF1-like protein n=1 Tax=Stakelama pacifica TaxID=517720 RepID=A0A4R6FJR4_9SPHN|nr:SURF1 family protein [Stakelama pacifica]TDN81643.1 surfeit locus 1 family protein [Stakelama pacifica]GGO96137.1 SURF1-like protein [Stakelama pacifica]
MKRIPIVSTIIVALCIGAMIALGIWQLERKAWKEALLERYAANIHKSEIAFPRFPDQSVLFRPASGFCLEPVSFDLEGAGKAGYRVIAHCRTGAEGPGMLVQLGTTRDPAYRPHWRGGEVHGFISHAPTHRSLIGEMLSPAPQPLLLVANTPPDGLSPNGTPELSSIPNNHFSYAVQWFLFAAIALVIYILALRRRRPTA